MKELLCFLFLSALTLTASELTGKWTGSFEITNSQGEKANTAFMDLRLNGNALTGTAGPNASEQVAIRNGKLEAGKLTFKWTKMTGPFRSTWYLMAILFAIQSASISLNSKCADDPVSYFR